MVMAIRGQGMWSRAATHRESLTGGVRANMKDEAYATMSRANMKDKAYATLSRANMKDKAYATLSRAPDLRCSPFMKPNGQFQNLKGTGSAVMFSESMACKPDKNTHPACCLYVRGMLACQSKLLFSATDRLII